MKAYTKIQGALSPYKSAYVDSFRVKITGKKQEKKNININYIDSDIMVERMIRIFHGFWTKKEKVIYNSIIRAISQGQLFVI